MLLLPTLLSPDAESCGSSGRTIRRPVLTFGHGGQAGSETSGVRSGQHSDFVEEFFTGRLPSQARSRIPVNFPLKPGTNRRRIAD
jgi:hypothetical protein